MSEPTKSKMQLDQSGPSLASSMQGRHQEHPLHAEHSIRGRDSCSLVPVPACRTGLEKQAKFIVIAFCWVENRRSLAARARHHALGVLVISSVDPKIDG